jgi:DNA polymerase-3 subunit beta
MKIICAKEVLAENINIVSKAVSSKTTLNILECILIISDDDGLRLIGNDLELGIETAPISAETLEKGSVALEARIFSDIIRRLPNAEVVISTDEKNITTIQCGQSEFKLLGQPGEEFPFLTKVEKSDPVVISATNFRDMIRQTIFSVALDDSKPAMTGELLQIKENVMTLVAVDGFRISMKRTPLETESVDLSVIVPAKTLNEISKIIGGDADQLIRIYFTDKHVLFELESCVVVSRLLEGDFIHFENLFTEDYTTLIYVNREDMTLSLDRASLISKDAKKNPIKIHVDHQTMVITSNTEIGTSHEELQIETDGVPLEIAFNPRYLIECLKAMEDERITIQFTTPLSPCIVKGEDNHSYKYLILPLRIKN